MTNSTSKRFFISYSRKDKRFVEPIAQMIRAAGADVFRDETCIPPGKKWQLLLEEFLVEADTIVVFWSANAATSQHVKSEYEKAAETGKDVIPILMDGTPLPPVLGQFQYVDCRGCGPLLSAYIEPEELFGPINVTKLLTLQNGLALNIARRLIETAPG